MRPRHALRWYFAVAFAIAWGGVLVTFPVRYAMFAAMLLGPSTAAITLTLAVDGTRGLRDLAHRLLRWRVGAWAAALLVAPALLVVVLGALSAVSPVFAPGIATASRPGSVALVAVVGGLFAGFFEELGWTGFVTPRLLRRGTWLGAGLSLGLIWATWHALPDLLGTSQGRLWPAHMLEWLAALMAYRALMTWIYSRTKSVLLAALLHASFTGSQLLAWPSAPPASELVWYGLFALGLWIVLGIVTVATLAAPRGAAARGAR